MKPLPEQYETPARTPRSVEKEANVVVLFAPAGRPREPFERTVEEWSSLETAILVVFPAAVDADIRERFETLGVDLCVTTPTSTQLFTSIDLARARHRRLTRGRFEMGRLHGDAAPTVASWAISNGTRRSLAGTVATGPP